MGVPVEGCSKLFQLFHLLLCRCTSICESERVRKGGREREREGDREGRESLGMLEGKCVHMCVCDRMCTYCMRACVTVCVLLKPYAIKLCRTSLVRLKLSFLVAFLCGALVLGLGLGSLSV